MQLIALTGGIASGKSTIGAELERLGAVRIDADQLARDAVEPGSPGLAQVVKRFGANVLDATGALDRAALGAIVFRDPRALNDLNAIVHPEVRRLAEERIQEVERTNADGVTVYEIPLFVESGAGSAESGFNWNAIIVADAPEDVRIKRLAQFRSMDASEAQRRIAQQASDEERRAVADVIIDTSGTIDHTIAQVHAFWNHLTSGSTAPSIAGG